MVKCLVKSVKGLDVTFEADGKTVVATANGVFVKRDVVPFVGMSAYVSFKTANGRFFFDKFQPDLDDAVEVNPFGGSSK